MISSVRTMWLSALVSASVLTVALAAGGDEYLPPNKGYNYDRPDVPFPPANNPVPFERYRSQCNHWASETSNLMFRGDERFKATPEYLYSDYLYCYLMNGFQYRITAQPTPPPYRPPVRPSPPPQRPTYIPPSSQPQQPHEHHDEHHEDHHHHEPGMPFDFAYSVSEDDNNFSHNAVSDGDITRGEYRVALPDGRTQIVKYTADWKNGFNADVSYEGEAKYPDAPAGGYGSGPAQAPSGGQQYVPPSQGGGYQY